MAKSNVSTAAPRRRTIRKEGPNPIDVFVGQRLRQARLLAGLTQSELGSSIGVTFQAVQKYERGDNRLSASRLVAAAEFLGKPVTFFFNELSPEAATLEQSGFSRQEIALVRYFRGIEDEEIREQVVRLIKQISGLETVPEESEEAPSAF
ncbi:MAG TPA: helix-turn-helix transcriptional regulator [Stellaceae bacterium]|nr:helix-turn-helix transcriptional regulator [Stellaceae bacterium]